MTTTTAPLNEADLIKGKIYSLQQKLLERAPDYVNLLKEIHYNLHQDPNMVHLLTDEEVGVIVAGLTLRANVVIATSQSKSKSSSGKKLKDIMLDEI